MPEPDATDPKGDDTDRRGFLTKAGKFAIFVPPAMTFLLSATMTSDAIASSSSNYQRKHDIRRDWR
jgi:hypothetical protein